ncbi:DUF2726 domain-containing protein [Escherichia coli]|nr:DUF2726 domain-containing protein [Escherichia coli]
MKLIIFILIVLIIAALLIRIILRSVNQHSPLLMQLHAAGIRTGDAERILSSGECWQRQKTLLTEREVSFMKGLFRIVDMKRWYLCPQVRVADIVQLNGNIRPRSRQWWQLFRMVSQWHVDVVIVERRSFSIVAAVELDDASHLRPERRRRDILLEEVLRQAGIPLLRSHDARKLLQMTGEWLNRGPLGKRKLSYAKTNRRLYDEILLILERGMLFYDLMIHAPVCKHKSIQKRKRYLPLRH